MALSRRLWSRFWGSDISCRVFVAHSRQFLQVFQTSIKGRFIRHMIRELICEWCFPACHVVMGAVFKMLIVNNGKHQALYS